MSLIVVRAVSSCDDSSARIAALLGDDKCPSRCRASDTEVDWLLHLPWMEISFAALRFWAPTCRRCRSTIVWVTIMRNQMNVDRDASTRKESMRSMARIQASWRMSSASIRPASRGSIRKFTIRQSRARCTANSSDSASVSPRITRLTSSGVSLGRRSFTLLSITFCGL